MSKHFFSKMLGVSSQQNQLSQTLGHHRWETIKQSLGGLKVVVEDSNDL